MPSIERVRENEDPVEVQMIFCIDVRSEPIRRNLEKQKSIETFGFAGFFGLPARIKEFHTNNTKDCLPVLLEPAFEISEIPCASEVCVNKNQKTTHILNLFISCYQSLKYNFSTPFALVEALGLWYGVMSILKTCSPRYLYQFLYKIKNLLFLNLKSHFNIQDDTQVKLPIKEQINYAETALRLMGLTEHFARMIVFCGHGSQSQNNPYASALNCGACGGHHGGLNAKLIAEILNNPKVRAGLSHRGIIIPKHTVFHAALHNTSTDDIQLYESSALKAEQQDLLKNLNIKINMAKQLTAEERCKQLNIKGTKAAARKSMDWSEIRPEWGLARNAAFIAAPRYLTADLNLQGRCFLHSYRWENDSDDSHLETILTAPMRVAQWINAQYLFSTIDNIHYGSGNKITHNITGNLGVMQGNGSDLMHGLPLQSVNENDSSPYHIPQRLMTIVHAPRQRVMNIIKKHVTLQRLFFNEWVHLIVIEPEEKKLYPLGRSGEWLEQ